MNYPHNMKHISIVIAEKFKSIKDRQKEARRKAQQLIKELDGGVYLPIQ